VVSDKADASKVNEVLNKENFHEKKEE